MHNYPSLFREERELVRIISIVYFYSEDKRAVVLQIRIKGGERNTTLLPQLFIANLRFLKTCSTNVNPMNGANPNLHIS